MFLLLIIPINFVYAGGSGDDTPTGEKMATCSYSYNSNGANVGITININDDGTIEKSSGSNYKYDVYFSNDDYWTSAYDNGIAANCPQLNICDEREQADGVFVISNYNGGHVCKDGSTAPILTGQSTYKSDKLEKDESEEKVYCEKVTSIRNTDEYKIKFVFFQDSDTFNKIKVSKIDKSGAVIGSSQTVYTDGTVGIGDDNIKFGEGVGSFFSNKCSGTPLYLQTFDSTNYTVTTNFPSTEENGAIDLNRKKQDETYDTNCPLGEDVTKDIYGLLKIVKIAAPLLVIALTIFEGVISLTKGDIQADMKKLYMRLIKRVVCAVILFFLPVLVNQIMIMADIWDENGTCDFSSSVEYTKTPANVLDNNAITSSCTKSCPASLGTMPQRNCISACESCMNGCKNSYSDDSDAYTVCINKCS